MNPLKVVFVSGVLGLGLTPDSRGYVQFILLGKDPSGRDQGWKSISECGPYTCEYLTDLIDLNVQAMKWISVNCEEICNDKQHLYFKFKD